MQKFTIINFYFNSLFRFLPFYYTHPTTYLHTT